MPIEMLSGFTANISMETQIQQNRRYTTIQLDIIHTGDCLEILKTLPDDSVHCCVTSPPYYALRDYGMEAQIGRETTPKEYISRLTEVFTEVRRVLRPDGTLWLNISDTYAGKGNQGEFIDPKNPNGRNGQAVALNNKVEGCKPKDMIGIPWMLAFALRDTGWYLRNDIIWMKDNPMPESVKDRCARCYEHIFLFSKSKKYFFDYKAISEPIAPATAERLKRGMKGGMEAQIGRETTPKEYISRLTEVFTEVRRVLRPDGTLWLNISDTYAGKGNQGEFIDPKNPNGRNGQAVALNNKVEGCKPKDMIGIPWMLAFALRDTGWYLRNDIIWMKDNPMPESVKDRCARCYEHIFLFSKSKKYFFDYKAISEPIAPATAERLKRGMKGGNKYGKPVPGQPQPQSINRPREHGEIKDADINPLRNKRDVWKINTVPFKGGHYAAYPPKLVETCLLAGCPEGGIVLDPFMGSGTTGMVASQMGRHFVGIELNPEYTELAYKRIGGEI